MRWRLFIEDYSRDLRYVKGEKNVVADALSRLKILEAESPDPAILEEEVMFQQYYYAKDKKARQSEEKEINPLNYQTLGDAQSKDNSLKLKLIKKVKHYSIKTFRAAGKHFDLICYKNKIVVAKTLQYKVIDWCYKAQN